MNPVGMPRYHFFNIKDGHVESGDPAFDRRMDAKLHDFFEQQHAVRPHAGAPALPDLSVSNITTDQLTVRRGDSPTIEITVVNNGTGAAGASHASVAVNDAYSATEPVPPLKPFQGVEVDFPASPDDPQGNFTPSGKGTYWVVAQADSQHELQEANPWNTRQQRWMLSVY